MKNYFNSTFLTAGAILLLTTSCSTFTAKFWQIENEPEEAESSQLEAPDESGTFVNVHPDFESLDPLYDLGFDGDFDKGMIAFDEKKYSRALSEWYPLAKEGDARAEYYLGIMYLNGLGMPEDNTQGAIWLQRSALHNDTEAQFKLGRLFIAGQKVELNIDQGIRWLLSAASNQHAGAQFNLGLLHQQGKVPLSSDLMAVYEQSISEVSNYHQAASWYQEAVKLGHGAAQNNLATLYLLGRGIEQSDAQALKLYTAAAHQGVIDAQYNLALLFEQGRGTVLDLQQALFWHGKAADQGYFPSQQRLPLLEMKIVSSNTSLALFGTVLSSTTRETMRDKIKNNAGNMLREQDTYWYDIYESSQLLPQTDRLFVGYSLQTDLVASLEYRFPSHNDANYVLSVIDMVKKKYGEPINSEGELSSGKIQYDWQVKDTAIKVTRYWPDTTVYLSYYIGSAYQQMLSEMPANAEELIYNMVIETY